MNVSGLMGFSMTWAVWAPRHRGALTRRGRDEALARAGYRVLRVEAEAVHRDLPGVLGSIRAALRGQR